MSGELKYTRMEQMIIAAAKMLENGKIVFVGTGMPLLAAMVAKALYSPKLVLLFEAGGIDPLPGPTLPISVGDSMTTWKASAALSMDYVMTLAQAGFIEYGMLGAAQIDMYGNINTTVIGPWEKPKVRFPGSGGANDIGSLCWRTIVIMRQDKTKFVEKLDFLTTPGYFNGPGARERNGLPRNTGPWRVVTQLGVYGFDEKDKKMTLMAVYPGVSLEEVKENSGFPIKIPEKIEVLPEPTTEELRVLRKLDPYGLVLGKG